VLSGVAVLHPAVPSLLARSHGSFFPRGPTRVSEMADAVEQP
jgi:hypothetical protein